MPEPPEVRIFIVDDEEAHLKALCDTLRDQGYHTVGFASAQRALAALKEQPCELLLADLNMPEMDGIALLREALVIDADLVGIIMTGEGTINTAVEAMKTGALDYILKPFKLRAVLPVLSRALAMRRLRGENAALARRVRERTTELEIANKELESFAYSVSHDLRAPLRHIMGYAEMLRDEPQAVLPAESRRHLEVIGECAQQMSTLIDDLLSFSRMGRAEMVQDSVSCDELVRAALQGLEQETKGRMIVWEIEPLPEVTADPSMLKQVWVNLLSNAIKYTRHREHAQIRVSSVPGQGATEFIVQDNGAGFDMQYADRLFGIFQRLHLAEQFEGTGIGLANARRIIIRHGGRIWAEGRVEVGATFHFTLPNLQQP